VVGDFLLWFQKVRRREKDTLALSEVTRPHDVLGTALDSPRKRPTRRGSFNAPSSTDSIHQLGPLFCFIFQFKRAVLKCGVSFTAADEYDPILLRIELLDGTAMRVEIGRSATVNDVLVTLRSQLGLRADADFSLFLRYYVCITASLVGLASRLHWVVLYSQRALAVW
jgi:hypothetical protein